MDTVAGSAFRRLPFSFANRYKLVLEPKESELVLYYIAPLAIKAITEVRRCVARALL